MKLDFTAFSGMIPRTDSESLDPSQAQYALNCDFHRKVLSPINAMSYVEALPDSLRQTIYPYNGAWLSWTTDVDVVQGPIPSDSYQRIYYTGDGVPKVRGIESTVEYEWPLGLPVPTAVPTLAVVTKSATSWTRTWGYYYEEPDGTQVDAGVPVEGTDITVSSAGKTYVLTTIPAKVAATASAVFVLWFDAYNGAGELLGRLYPKHSANYLNSDLQIDGATVVGTQTNATSATLELAYDTSAASDYTKERAYVYTFVTAWGEEGPPSGLSRTVAVDPTQDVVISGLDAASPAGYNVTELRIYRTVTGDDGTLYQFVTDLAIGTTDYTDSMTDADTGEAIVSTTWIAPPIDLAGLVAMPGGFLAAFTGKTVCFSEPLQPHAWPEGYQQVVDHDIVGLGVTGNTLIVLTTGPRYAMAGSEPSAMTVSRIALPHACVAKRSIAEYGSTVIDASSVGVVATDGGNTDIATRKFFTDDEWSALGPSTMQIRVHDNQLYVFSSTASAVFDFNDSQSLLTYTSETCDGMYVDPDTDDLYFIQSGAIWKWGGSTTPKTLTWKSKLFRFARPATFAVGKVAADTYNGTQLKIYVNSVLHSTITVTSEAAFRLPKIEPHRLWEIEVVSVDTISRIVLAGSMAEVGT